LDDDTLASLNESGKIHGLIFLFKWEKPESSSSDTAGGESKPKNEPLSEEQIPPGLFFAHQVTTNACATQAILSVVLNSQGIALGSTLDEFKDFTSSFPPSLKGVAISSSDPIRKAHNAFGRTDAFLNDGKYVAKHRQSEDVFHFVAYIPKDGTVYELDGLKSGPVAVGTVQGDGDWLSTAREAIQERMTGDAISFNLMAVIEDKREGLKKKIAADPSNEELMHLLHMEDEKRKQWSLENQRRQHNYVPLCVSILRELARAKKLPDLIDDAKKRKRQKLTAGGAEGKLP
jgi:ubiquitin carboxyl-terminal hydrolase L5